MILIPISDDNDERHARHRHDFIHYGLIVLCIAVFIYEFYLIISGDGAGRLENWIDRYSFDPRMLGSAFLALSFPDRVIKLAAHLAHVENFAILKMLASTFMHGGLMHLFSNMFVLWMLGDNVEYAMGHIRYLLFFLLAGIVSECGDVVFATAQTFRGGIGASGAIMAVAGAYMFYFPKARINFFYVFGIFWWGVFSVSARIVIAVYILSQMALAIHNYGTNYDNVGIWAHVTGFVMGLTLAWFLRKDRKQPLSQPEARKAYARSVAATIRARQQGRDYWGNDPRR